MNLQKKYFPTKYSMAIYTMGFIAILFGSGIFFFDFNSDAFISALIIAGVCGLACIVLIGLEDEELTPLMVANFARYARHYRLDIRFFKEQRFIQLLRNGKVSAIYTGVAFNYLKDLYNMSPDDAGFYNHLRETRERILRVVYEADEDC